MKFYLSNEVVYNKIRKFKGEIIDIPTEKIDEFKKLGVLGTPVKEVVIETAVIKPVENEMINRNIEKAILDTSHFPIPRVRPKNIKKKGKK